MISSTAAKKADEKYDLRLIHGKARDVEGVGIRK